MTWYEPKSRPPLRGDSHRLNQGGLTVHSSDYLDENWSLCTRNNDNDNNDNNDENKDHSICNGPSGCQSEIHAVKFDGLQHRVESHLANIFPSSSRYFSTTGSSFPQTFNDHHWYCSTNRTTPSNVLWNTRERDEAICYDNASDDIQNKNCGTSTALVISAGAGRRKSPRNETQLHTINEIEHVSQTGSTMPLITHHQFYSPLTVTETFAAESQWKDQEKSPTFISKEFSLVGAEAHPNIQTSCPMTFPTVQYNEERQHTRRESDNNQHEVCSHGHLHADTTDGFFRDEMQQQFSPHQNVTKDDTTLINQCYNYPDNHPSQSCPILVQYPISEKECKINDNYFNEQQSQQYHHQERTQQFELVSSTSENRLKTKRGANQVDNSDTLSLPIPRSLFLSNDQNINKDDRGDKSKNISKAGRILAQTAASSSQTFKSIPIQSVLTQNSKTGKLCLEKFTAIPSKTDREKSWDNYHHGRTELITGHTAGTTEVKRNSVSVTAKITAREKKKKTALTSKVNKAKNVDMTEKQTDSSGYSKRHQSEINILDSSMSYDENHDTKKKRRSDFQKANKPKKLDRSSQHLNNATFDEPPDGTTTIDSIDYDKEAVALEEAYISISEFYGLEEMNILNAANCKQGLQYFLSIIEKQKQVAWAMLFLDKYFMPKYSPSHSSKDIKGGRKGKEFNRRNKFTLPLRDAGFMISTAFSPTCKKYCTVKGPPCHNWNCICDLQIRAKRASAALLGAMFLFKDSSSEVDESMQCYILPLGPLGSTNSNCIIAEYDRMAHWPKVPFECDVSLPERWDAFKAIMTLRNTKLVTYNATVSLLPLYHHLIHDNYSRTDGISVMDNQRNHHPPLLPDECLYSIWDLRLSSWMLRPDATDEELEFESFQEGFSHMIQDCRHPNYQELTVISRGLLEVKKNLSFLLALFPLINRQLIEKDLLHAYENIEAPVQSILTAMECRGIAFLPHRLQRVQSQVEERIQVLEAQSRTITKDSNFLLSSPQQVSFYLFETLNLAIPSGFISNTKAGSSHRSTSEEALQAIKEEMMSHSGNSHPILDVIIEFRALNKLLTTYIRPLPTFCFRLRKSRKVPYRIHPQWVQTAVRTGRLSCRKPNLQQVPKEAVYDAVNPRKAFVSSDKNTMCLFACDYSQQEVRILAHMSCDDALLSLFRGNTQVDIYKQMSSIIRGKPIEAVTVEDRAQFKQVTLAIIYGMSPNQVAKKLQITKTAALQMMNDFFSRFHGVKKWMNLVKDFARTHQYVLTIAGRRRYLYGINSSDDAQKNKAERQAINTVIQGSAADLMKSAMINLTENLRCWKGDGTFHCLLERPRILLQLHDELILELKLDEDHITQLKAIALKSCCQDCEAYFRLKIPLLLNCSCGISWQAMKEI